MRYRHGVNPRAMPNAATDANSNAYTNPQLEADDHIHLGQPSHMVPGKWHYDEEAQERRDFRRGVFGWVAAYALIVAAAVVWIWAYGTH